MTFKIHLFIVSIIIIVLFLFTQYALKQKQNEQTTVQLAPTSPYTITIERASWGLNCRQSSSEKTSDNYMSSNNGAKLKENNVLSTISSLCNVKPHCSIAIDPAILGEDPLPTCGYKELKVEYRCFAVDRIRVEKATDGIIDINCDKQLATP